MHVRGVVHDAGTLKMRHAARGAGVPLAFSFFVFWNVAKTEFRYTI